MTEQTRALTTTQQVDKMLTTGVWRNQFEGVLGKNYGLFKTSMVSLMTGDKTLQKCDPKLILAEALKAASLGLTVNKNMGHAFIVPFGEEPTLIIGYKGLIQLALNTNQYKHINADMVYEGEEVTVDRLRGTIIISGNASSRKVIGYFAFIELINGYEAAVYMTVDGIRAHAQRYSPSYRAGKKIWKENFDGMAKKTCLRMVFKFGYMSVEMQEATVDDYEEDPVGSAERGKQIDENSEDIIIGDYTVVEEAGVKGETEPSCPF